MGFLGRLFGVYSPEERVQRARAYLASGEPNEARLEVLEVQHPDAESVLAQALEALVELNLSEARARFTSLDEEGGKEHIEMAREFGASAQQLREVRKEAREIRAAERRKELAAEQAAKVVETEGDDPLWSLPPSDPRVRFAMLVEGYPADLRERLAKLGKDFATAVLLLEDGQPAAAWKALSAFVEEEPAARFERARAALATRELTKAASDLATVGDHFGHQRIGALHTGVTLAQLYAQLGRHQDALDLCDAELRRAPDVAMLATRAHLLSAVGRYPEAEQATTVALKQSSKDLNLYRLLGIVRLKQDNRIGAMQALEAGLNVNNCSNPMKCGFKPPDLPSLRLLARLYLEDRLEPKRAREVVEMLQGMVQEATWDDAYVAALLARNEGSPDLSKMVAALKLMLPGGDPRVALLDEQFAAKLTG